jgi:hypothetical protein
MNALANANNQTYLAHIRSVNAIALLATEQWGGKQVEWFKGFHEGHAKENGAYVVTKKDYGNAMANLEYVRKVHPNAKEPVWVEARPFHDRLPGDCYKNALTEYKNTKNPIAIVLCYDIQTTYIDHYYLHAINYDPKTKTYYDRGVMAKGAWGFVIAQGEEVLNRFNILNELQADAKKSLQRAYAAGGKEREKHKEKYLEKAEKLNAYDYPLSTYEVYVVKHGEKKMTVRSIGCAHRDTDDYDGLRMELVA